MRTGGGALHLWLHFLLQKVQYLCWLTRGNKVIASEVDFNMLISKFVGKASTFVRGRPRWRLSTFPGSHWLANISSAR
jgi:hypothetical protein